MLSSYAANTGYVDNRWLSSEYSRSRMAVTGNIPFFIRVVVRRRATLALLAAWLLRLAFKVITLAAGSTGPTAS
jgi:hypothetical protein